MRRRSWIGLCAAALIWAVPCAAQDTSPNFQAVATAKTLFEQGKQQLADGHVDLACASFKASNDAVARVGTLLNLGDCYEKLGKLASAWGAYFDAISLGRRQGKPEYEDFAQKKKDELEPKLLKMTIVVPAENKVDGMKISRDKVAVEGAAWGVPIPVDAGPHAIDVTAPHKLPFHKDVVVDEAHKVLEVTIDKLEEAPTAWPKSTEPQVVERIVEVPSVWTGLRVAGVVAGGVGLAATVVGIVLGVVANSTYQNALTQQCGGNPSNCTAQGAANGSTAYTLAGVATGLFIGGLVAVAAGVTFFIAGAPSSSGGSVTVGARF
jgi:hypothetical protein